MVYRAEPQEYSDEVYGYTSETGEQMPQPKGDLYKSGYHTMENALMNYLYLELYVHHKTANLFFNLSAPEANTKHYVNILESPSIIIKKVEINGAFWEKYNAKEGFILLPKGQNMKVKVTLTIVR